MKAKQWLQVVTITSALVIGGTAVAVDGPRVRPTSRQALQ